MPSADCILYIYSNQWMHCIKCNQYLQPESQMNRHQRKVQKYKLFAFRSFIQLTKARVRKRANLSVLTPHIVNENVYVHHQ